MWCVWDVSLFCCWEACTLSVISRAGGADSHSYTQGWTLSLYMLDTLCWVSTSRSAGRCASRRATGSGYSKACGQLHCGCSSLTCCTGRNSFSKYKLGWSSVTFQSVDAIILCFSSKQTVFMLNYIDYYNICWRYLASCSWLNQFSLLFSVVQPTNVHFSESMLISKPSDKSCSSNTSCSTVAKVWKC